MASIRQIEANRFNAKKSTGPRTAEGKSRSRMNALKSGIDAQAETIPTEDPAPSKPSPLNTSSASIPPPPISAISSIR